MSGSRPLRVLHVVPYFPPARIGGVGEVVAHLHEGLLARGHDSTVLTAGEAPGELSVRRIARTPLGFVLRCAGASGLAVEHDLIHCHHGDALALLLVQRLRRRRAPVLVTFHVGSGAMGESFRPHRVDGHVFGNTWRNRAYRWLNAPFHRLVDSAALALADSVSFISRSAALDVLGEEAGSSATVVYNALPVAMDAVEDEPAAPADILWVGTPNYRKRTHLLPFVLREVREQLPQVRLRIVGFRLQDAPELQRLFAALGVEDAVVCEGPVTSAEIRRFYRAARVQLVPSAYEGLPMVILEGYQCGLPCVATEVSGHPEVIQHGRTGYLVPPDDPAAMAARTVEILERPDLARKMGEAGRQVVAEQFGLDRQVREYLKLYSVMLSR